VWHPFLVRRRLREPDVGHRAERVRSLQPRLLCASGRDAVLNLQPRHVLVCAGSGLRDLPRRKRLLVGRLNPRPVRGQLLQRRGL
jgi:hypothetical protein